MVYQVHLSTEKNALHAFFMMKKGSGQHLEMEELKKCTNANAYKNTVSHVYTHLQVFGI
ncbi:unnamed protein product [Staurois parvus]|uniref:Uncharacterized protein n=1 Tax=Staurois parvus TaxID=386267 RepID=A0ABN9ALS0_9NEOB|nr:unnamed protein product [Staurois parvus]